jgi:hypothetical protein
MDKLKLTGLALGRVFNFRSDCMHTMHLLPSLEIQPNLELKTQPKQLLGSLLLVMALLALTLDEVVAMSGSLGFHKTENQGTLPK